MKKFVITALVCFSALAGNQVGEIVSGSDGNQYKLVKAEQRQSNGAIEIAEFVRVGDNSGTRYGMRLTAPGAKPSFWKLSP